MKASRAPSHQVLPHSVSTANYGNYDDPAEIEMYDQMLRETDFPPQRELMRQFEKLVLDTEAHEIFLLCVTASCRIAAMSKAGR